MCAAIALGASLASFAQQQHGRTDRIGLFLAETPSAQASSVQALCAGLRDLGYSLDMPADKVIE
jgi:hypothetical protein